MSLAQLYFQPYVKRKVNPECISLFSASVELIRQSTLLSLLSCTIQIIFTVTRNHLNQTMSMPGKASFDLKLTRLKPNPFFQANYIFTQCLFSVNSSCTLHNTYVCHHTDAYVQMSFFSLM